MDGHLVGLIRERQGGHGLAVVVRRLHYGAGPTVPKRCQEGVAFALCIPHLLGCLSELFLGGGERLGRIGLVAGSATAGVALLLGDLLFLLGLLQRRFGGNEG